MFYNKFRTIQIFPQATADCSMICLHICSDWVIWAQVASNARVREKMASSGKIFAQKFDLFLNSGPFGGSRHLVDFQQNKLYEAFVKQV